MLNHVVTHLLFVRNHLIIRSVVLKAIHTIIVKFLLHTNSGKQVSPYKILCNITYIWKLTTRVGRTFFYQFPFWYRYHYSVPKLYMRTRWHLLRSYIITHIIILILYIYSVCRQQDRLVFSIFFILFRLTCLQAHKRVQQSAVVTFITQRKAHIGTCTYTD